MCRCIRKFFSIRRFRQAVRTFITWKNDSDFDGIDQIASHCSDEAGCAKKHAADRLFVTQDVAKIGAAVDIVVVNILAEPLV